MFIPGKNIVIQPNKMHLQPGGSVGIVDEIALGLSKYQQVSLEQITSVRLMDRLDIKYIVPIKMIPELLQKAVLHYKVQEIDNKRIAKYETLYLDTQQYAFYHSHLNGKLNRLKVRIRKYTDTKQSFLEIKKKNNKGRTHKSRINHSSIGPLLSAEDYDFLKNNAQEINALELHPALSNSFSRITLINHSFSERLTIDFGLSFQKPDDKQTIDFSTLGIIEIKQDRFAYSPMKQLLSLTRIRKTGISKYCLGISLLNKHLKSNNYNPKIRQLYKKLNYGHYF